MNKILITGGAGFIGAHAAKALIDQGKEVVLLDNFNSLLYSAELKEARLEAMFPENKPRLINGDILDEELLNTVMQEEGITKVLHFAALANPGRSVRYAQEYTATNVNGTLQVLEACTRNDITQLILAGSSSLYNDEQVPFTEDSYPLRPKSPYGASKAAAETYCRMWHELYGLPITILRFFSAYGPWGRPDMAPMIFADQILSDTPLRVTKERKRDFTHIDDIVRGILLAIEKRFDFEIINLGRGEPAALEDFVQILSQQAGKEARIEARDAPEGEMKITFADIAKAKNLLGYEPEVSLEDGARSLIEWMRKEPRASAWIQATIASRD